MTIRSWLSDMNLAASHGADQEIYEIIPPKL